MPSPERPSPDRRIVLVTGAANGIGWATARRFAAAGDIVALADIDIAGATARLPSLPGTGHFAIPADLGDPAATRAMVAAVLAQAGRIDVLVNNAGRIDAQATPVPDVKVDDFRKLLAVNLEGGFVAAEACAAAMLRQGGGAIVNLASGAGITAIPFRNAYGASKGAVIAMTRSLAQAWPGVRVNAVAPGYIRTEMVDSLARNGKIDLSRVERRIPLGRLGQTEEMAEVIHFLAGADAACVNGALWVADGGYLAFGGSGDAGQPGRNAPAARPGQPVAVIIGDGPIGTAIAQRLTADGAKIIRLATTDETALAQAMAATFAAEGRIDTLITGADPIPPIGDSFMASIDAGLTTCFLACREAGRHMLGQGWGSIVNLTGLAGLVATPDLVAEGAAMAGVAMLSRNLACEWAAAGIRVNTLAHTAGPAIAGAVTFLAGPAASYVTGSVLVADG